MIAAGDLPELAALAKQGSFIPLEPTNPAQSPVSWATLTTGLNPGRTGIFDFLRREFRDDGGVAAELAFSRTTGAWPSAEAGEWAATAGVLAIGGLLALLGGSRLIRKAPRVVATAIVVAASPRSSCPARGRVETRGCDRRRPRPSSRGAGERARRQGGLGASRRRGRPDHERARADGVPGAAARRGHLVSGLGVPDAMGTPGHLHACTARSPFPPAAHDQHDGMPRALRSGTQGGGELSGSHRDRDRGRGRRGERGRGPRAARGSTARHAS